MSDEDKTDKYEDEIEAAKANERLISDQEDQDSQDDQSIQMGDESRNISLTETDIKVIGDRTVIAQTVQLLSYVRHMLKNNASGSIRLDFGNEIANVEFNFSVNGCQIPDLVPGPAYKIN